MRLRIVTVAVFALSVPLALPPRAALCQESVSGRWSVTIERPEHTRDYTMELRQEGETVSGSLTSPRSGAHAITRGSFKDDVLEIAIERTLGGEPAVYEFEGKLADGAISGAFSISGERAGAFRMTRGERVSLLGRWNASAVAPDGGRTYDAVLEITRGDDGLRGSLTSERGRLELRSVRGGDDGVRLEFDIERDGETREIVVEARLDGPHRLRGRWVMRDTDLAGEWTAERAAAARGLAGTWDVTASTDSDTVEYPIDLRRHGDGYAATYRGPGGPVEFSTVRLDGDDVVLELTIEFDGNPVPFVIRARRDGADTLRGRWQVREAPEFAGGWSARRAATAPAAARPEPPAVPLASIAGRWALSGVNDEGDTVEAELRLELRGDGLAGRLQLGDRDFDAGAVTVSGKTISFSVRHEVDGEVTRVEVKGTLDGDAMSGEWKTGGGDTGTWSAKRIRVADL